MSPPRSFMEELKIDMAEIRRRMAFVDFSDRDVRLLREMEGLIEKNADGIVAAFYQHHLSFEETRSFLNDPGTVDRLMKFQKEYLLEIFRANFDADYFERQLRIGAVHQRIGLPPKWYIGTFCLYENLLSPIIQKAYAQEPDGGLSRIMAVRKIFRLDMALVLDFYYHRVTAQLEEKVREMDEFTHVVSHDLKEPLRSIEAFSGFLLEDYTSRLDGEGKRYLQFLKDSAVRMKSLIDDLLILASLTQKKAEDKMVDLNQVMDKILRNLDFSIQKKGAVIRIPTPLPSVPCDPFRIGQVFENLLSNALKYNLSTSPQIEIGVQEEETGYRIAVRDNGIGFEPQYQEKIFQIFERLHPQEVFEGTGAGLAICKKVIDGYGGRIWAESRPGEGSTFFFTLPKKWESRFRDGSGNGQ